MTLKIKRSSNFSQGVFFLCLWQHEVTEFCLFLLIKFAVQKFDLTRDMIKLKLQTVNQDVEEKFVL